jgi:catechol 2,3-dioxygenase-like lactoylglutathione lyase family enzyme
VGSVRLGLIGEGRIRGIASWSVRGLEPADLDGLPTEGSETPLPEAAPPHPNGAISLDHVVAFSPDLDRTLAALQEAGLDLRRVREGPTPGGSHRQGFFRLGEALLEVIEAPEGSAIRSDPDGPARLWGLAFMVESLETTAAVLGDRLGEPRDAVQPGRRIATVQSSAGLGAAVAFMTPGPGAI